ncbi:MAG: hypothetical protein V1922_01900 [bacterium]
MSTLLFPIQKGLSMAFLRLQVWFDPAQTGTPYETFPPKQNGKVKRNYPFFSKRLSIRV